MPFLPPNEQRQSTEGTNLTVNRKIFCKLASTVSDTAVLLIAGRAAISRYLMPARRPAANPLGQTD